VRRYVEQEKQRRRVCASCGQITYLNPKVVAGLIPVMPDGRIVLLRRSIEPALGKWTYPAGFQEMGESVREAAIRETREEIGVGVTARQTPLGVYSYPEAGVVTIVFAGRVNKGGKPWPAHEAEQVQIFKLGQIPWNSLAFRSTRDALRDWKKSLRRSLQTC
jgi:ADP-ribose pyrophosphatase YjhB (NUDIX family)